MCNNFGICSWCRHENVCAITPTEWKNEKNMELTIWFCEYNEVYGSNPNMLKHYPLTDPQLVVDLLLEALQNEPTEYCCCGDDDCEN